MNGPDRRNTPGHGADPERSACVLIGVGTYTDPDLPSLPAVQNNLIALKEALTDPGIWGVSEEHCLVVADPTTPSEVVDAISAAVEAAEDTLLIYYTGHGLIDADGSLLLTLADTKPGRSYTALQKTWVRNLISMSRARSRILILDCCYSGRATAPTAAREVLPPAGFDFALWTPTTDLMAMAPPGEPHTSLTGQFLRVLNEGIPDGPEFLTLESMAAQIHASSQAQLRPSPAWQSNSTGWQPFVANRAYRPQPEAARTPYAPDTKPSVHPDALNPPLRIPIMMRLWLSGLSLLALFIGVLLLPPAHGWWWPATLTLTWVAAAGWGIAAARHTLHPPGTSAGVRATTIRVLADESPARRRRQAFREGLFAPLTFATATAARRPPSPSPDELLHAAYIRLGPPPTTSGRGVRR